MKYWKTSFKFYLAIVLNTNLNSKKNKEYRREKGLNKPLITFENELTIIDKSNLLLYNVRNICTYLKQKKIYARLEMLQSICIFHSLGNVSKIHRTRETTPYFNGY